jgi:hypothetical protein
VVTYRTREIFVPGGQPLHTYVARTTRDLEGEVRAASDNLCKLVTVTGPTKSGKSVLVGRAFPRDRAVWLDGGSASTEPDIWSQITEQLDVMTTTTRGTQEGTSSGYGGEASVEGALPLVAKAGAKGTISRGRSDSSTETVSRTTTSKAAAISALRSTRTPLVFDDFHYLDRDVQGAVVRALKSLVFVGAPCILLAIPHRRYDAVRVEREMTGRVHQVQIPEWTDDELKMIPAQGLPLLDAQADDALVDFLVSQALSSPHLVQEFFRALCIEAGVLETARPPAEVKPKKSAQDLLSAIAKDLARPVFDALAKGPRQRKDRLMRDFRDGRKGDIYFAILNAIAATKLNGDRIEYEDVRSRLRDLLVDLPQAHEVSRVLEHMSQIQVGEASAPVLDWDKENRRLHITDPYFAFFLKWGADVFAKEYIAQLNA